MKKAIVLLSFTFCATFILQAAIPIAESKKTEPRAEQTIVKPQKDSKLKTVIKKFLDKPAKKDRGIFNILSLVCGVLGIILTATTGLGGIPFMIAAVILGIIGLSRREKYKGMGIAGISLGGGMIVLFFLTIALIAVACG